MSGVSGSVGQTSQGTSQMLIVLEDLSKPWIWQILTAHGSVIFLHSLCRIIWRSSGLRGWWGPGTSCSIPKMFQAGLERSWSNLVSWKGSLLMAEGWNGMSFKVLSNANHSGILWIWNSLFIRNMYFVVNFQWWAKHSFTSKIFFSWKTEECKDFVALAAIYFEQFIPVCNMEQIILSSMTLCIFSAYSSSQRRQSLSF